MTKLTSSSTFINTNKATYVNELFAKIADKYDLLNNLMTFGLHKKWKKETILLALEENKSPEYALDLCAGTCDLSITLNNLSPNTKITCIDNCNSMLEAGLHKIKSLKLKNIEVSLLDSENLPFKGSSYDLITIGFGLRNLDNKEKIIKDIFNLLKDNGVFACIDLGHPKNNVWRKIFFFYFFNIVPKLGQIFAQNKEAYSYLPNSLLNYYNQEELKKIILSKGFRKCYFKNILGGIVAIHIAIK